jgi:small basic protein
MQLLPIVALAAGFMIFWQIGALPSDPATARYLAIAVLAGLDTILGGVYAWLTDVFDDAVFISGFILNALLAVGLVALGEHLGLETGFGDGRISVMLIGAVVVFTNRILKNLALLRRHIIKQYFKSESDEAEAKAAPTRSAA